MIKSFEMFHLLRIRKIEISIAKKYDLRISDIWSIDFEFG